MREYTCKCGAGYYVKEPGFIVTHNGIFSYSEDDIYPVLIRFWNGSFCTRCANLAIQFLLHKGLLSAGVYFYAFFRGGFICNRKAICRLYREEVSEFWKISNVKYENGVFHIGDREIIAVRSSYPFCDIISDGNSEEIPDIIRKIDTYPYSTINNSETALDGAKIAVAMGLKRAVWMRPFEAYVINTAANTIRGGSL